MHHSARRQGSEYPATAAAVNVCCFAVSPASTVARIGSEVGGSCDRRSALLRNVVSVRRRVLRAIVLMTVVGLALSAPAHVAACTCLDELPGDVVFTGKVVDSPNGSIFFSELEVPQSGVYTFDVDSVTRGDPLDGRVFSGPGNCSSLFQLGATYRVHARVVDPGEEYPWNRSGVPLETNLCMAGELIEPADPLIAIRALAASPPGMILIGGSLAFLSAALIYLRRRRTSSTGIGLARSD